MPMYDRHCTKCEWNEIDVMEPVGAKSKRCPKCFADTTRCSLTKRANAVIDDSIPGGVYIRHGICHEDGSPKRYDSKSDIKRAAEAKGLTNYVVHVPTPGSDKAPHTTRWV